MNSSRLADVVAVVAVVVVVVVVVLLLVLASVWRIQLELDED